MTFVCSMLTKANGRHLLCSEMFLVQGGPTASPWIVEKGAVQLMASLSLVV